MEMTGGWLSWGVLHEQACYRGKTRVLHVQGLVSVRCGESVYLLLGVQSRYRVLFSSMTHKRDSSVEGGRSWGV